MADGSETGSPAADRNMVWKYNSWIVTTPRSGSTYLCYLLNRAVGLPLDGAYNRRIFAEHFHPELAQSRDELIARRPIATKVHRPHFLHFFRDDQKDLIHSVWPGLRLVRLKRRDLHAQAVSCYLARRTKQHHAHNHEQLQEWLQCPIDYDEQELRRAWRDVQFWEAGWDAFLQGEDYLVVDYEDLLASPEREVARVLQFLGREDYQIDLDVPLVKMSRPETGWYIERLHELVDSSDCR